jgi:hypothetical protein
MDVSITQRIIKVACPRCHAPDSFGPRKIIGQFWMTRCSRCRYYTYKPLPPITKRIIYLDQCFLSHALRDAKEPRWKAACDKLRALIRLDYAICPYSQVHQDESLLAEYSRDDLKALYRELSGGGTEFLSPDEIEERQLLDAMQCFLGQAQMPRGQWQKPRPWGEFCRKDPHLWLNWPAVFVDFAADPTVIEWLQESKARLHCSLEVVADNWRDEDTQTPNDDVKREALACGKAAIAGYRELTHGRKAIENMLVGVSDDLLEQYREIVRPGAFDPRIPPGPQPGVRLVHWLAVEVHKARPDEADPVSVVDEFFASEVALNVPFLYITSHLRAAMAHEVRKANRRLLPSDTNDLTAVAHYAPYCDAMFLDNSFRALADQKRVDVPNRYGVKLFSARTIPDFIKYLDELLHNMPRRHREALRLVHPELADVPFLNPENDGE